MSIVKKKKSEMTKNKKRAPSNPTSADSWTYFLFFS